MWSYFWSVFSCIRTRNNSVFGQFSRSVTLKAVSNVSREFLVVFLEHLLDVFQQARGLKELRSNVGTNLIRRKSVIVTLF